MATKDTEELKQELRALQAQKRGLELELAECPESERQQLEALIYNVSQECDKISKQIAQLETREQRAERKSNWKSEKPTVDRAIDENHIGYIANEDKFIYCKDFGVNQINVQFKLVNASRIVRVLSKLAGIAIHGKDQNELIDYFQERGASYLDVTSSFNTNKWRESDIYNKMSVIRNRWLLPVDDGEPYHSDLDLLIHCVGGGKPENIEHLERWIVFKYLYPGKNANMPNIDMGGNPGGNGKNTLITMLKTIFTPACVIQAHKDELDKFNASWEMAVILYYDEAEEKELAASKLKQATGADDLRIEKKGIDPTMADRNFNFIFMSNNQNGVVKLSGGPDGGEDRRYSVMNTDLVLLDMYLDAGFAIEDAKIRLNELQSVVKNPVEVGRWLACKIAQYSINAQDNISALHGQDYHNRFQEQKDALTECFDAMLPVFNSHGLVPLSVLVDIVQAHTGLMKISDRTVSRNWTTYLKRNKIDFEVRERARYTTKWKGQDLKTAQGKVFARPGATQTDWQWDWVSSVSPNYNSIGIPLAKTDLIL